MNRIDALQGIKTNLGFELGAVLTAFLRHGDRFPDFGLTIRPVQLSGTTSVGSKWVYAATVAHPEGTPITITATAVDRPGNKGTKAVTWG